MPFVKVESGVVVQKQLQRQTGFIEVGDEVCCGMVSKPGGVFVAPDPDIETVRAIVRNDVRQGYETSCLLAVTALGIFWDGGFESAIKLDAAQRLNQAANLPDVTFFDSENQPHQLSFEDALEVIITVAATFQYKLAKKQALMRTIDSASAEDLLDIAWVEE